MSFFYYLDVLITDVKSAVANEQRPCRKPGSQPPASLWPGAPVDGSEPQPPFCQEDDDAAAMTADGFGHLQIWLL